MKVYRLGTSDFKLPGFTVLVVTFYFVGSDIG
jgi:hypothetical protein